MNKSILCLVRFKVGKNLMFFSVGIFIVKRKLVGVLNSFDFILLSLFLRYQEHTLIYYVAVFAELVYHSKGVSLFL